MDRELLFGKTLEEIKHLAKGQGNCISKEQIAEAFSKLGLAQEQLALVEEYLKEHKIGIGEPLNPKDYLTEGEVRYLDVYLEELKGMDAVTEGEKEAFSLSAMAGDGQAQARLVEIYLPKVVEIAKLYGGQGVALEDLIGEGNLALAAGVSMLGCLEHACEVEGMLGKRIMDAMEECIYENLEQARKDKKALEHVNLVAKQARELAEALQRKVTVEELAAETELSEDEILEAIRISGNQMEYIKGLT